MRRIVVAATLAAVSSFTVSACTVSPGGTPVPFRDAEVRRVGPSGSLSKAYEFLRLMMDKYATGSTMRLVQSFDGGPLKGFNDAVTYDDALLVDALLAQGSADGVSRSIVVGNAFLYIQAHDKAGDGRLRAAYAPKPLRKPSDIVVDDNTSDVGNMAWVGQALVQLYAKTSDRTYLDGALRIARWLQTNAYDTRGAGGYTGGYTARGAKIEWKSTEHNIDIYAFFTMLATSGQHEWTSHAAWAEQFVASTWDAPAGRFYVGTLNDGKTPNKAFKPEDVNSWSYLAFANRAWAAAPSWDVTNLAVSKGGFSGVSFCSGDRSGVWFEGTAHLADALELRNESGDPGQARNYLDDIAFAQAHGPNNDGRGIIAASKNGLSDCDGDKYFASLHVGATAWYIMAAGAVNPFVLLPMMRPNRE
ncbi:MAG: hypothetical protein JO104_03710 [Candidatus Eremiobacteraeota bacterium]|nr:hypothetical protein [Candidatus Eremiobacteraeota bacterium]